VCMREKGGGHKSDDEDGVFENVGWLEVGGGGERERECKRDCVCVCVCKKDGGMMRRSGRRRMVSGWRCVCVQEGERERVRELVCV